MESKARDIESTCLSCGNLFPHRPTLLGKRIYCGRVCYVKDRRPRSKVQKECQVCKTPYFASKYKNTKYCDLKCRSLGHRKDPDKLVNLRHWLIKENRFNSCENCGYNEHTSILGIHHKNREHNDNRIENLAVLCANCHSLEHKRHIVHGGTNNGYLGE